MKSGGVGVISCYEDRKKQIISGADSDLPIVEKSHRHLEGTLRLRDDT